MSVVSLTGDSLGSRYDYLSCSGVVTSGSGVAGDVAAAPMRTPLRGFAGDYLLWPITVATNTPAATGIAIPQGGCLGGGCLRQFAITQMVINDGDLIATGQLRLPGALSSETVGGRSVPGMTGGTSDWRDQPRWGLCLTRLEQW